MHSTHNRYALVSSHGLAVDGHCGSDCIFPFLPGKGKTHSQSGMANHGVHGDRLDTFSPAGAHLNLIRCRMPQPFSRTLRKEPALSEAEGVDDGDHRCTL